MRPRSSASALGLLFAGACGGGTAENAPPPDPAPGATPQIAGPVAATPERDTVAVALQPSPNGLGDAAALGQALLAGTGGGLGDDDLRVAWQLLVRDPRAREACEALCDEAFTFRGFGLGALGVALSDRAAFLERLAGRVEMPERPSAPSLSALRPSRDEVRDALGPAARLAFAALCELPGDDLRGAPGSFAFDALAALAADPRGGDALLFLAEEGPTLHGRVAGLLGLGAAEPSEFARQLARFRDEDAGAPAAAQALAEAVLEATDRFEGAAVGEGGETPATCWAFRVLAEAPDAAERFRGLAEIDSVPARLYAACGLRRLGRPEAAAVIASLRTEGGTVPTMFGCIVSRDAVASLVAAIESGELPRELAGR
jgi:hypothetical protein